MKTILNLKRPALKDMPAPVVDASLEDTIRQRAYELYEKRGHEDGHELEDWLQAEAEVKQKAAAA